MSEIKCVGELNSPMPLKHDLTAIMRRSQI